MIMMSQTRRDKNRQNKASVIDDTMTMVFGTIQDGMCRSKMIAALNGSNPLRSSKGSRFKRQGSTAQNPQGRKGQGSKAESRSVMLRECPGASYVSLFLIRNLSGFLFGLAHHIKECEA